jgi:hypothetical protein
VLEDLRVLLYRKKAAAPYEDQLQTIVNHT